MTQPCHASQSLITRNYCLTSLRSSILCRTLSHSRHVLSGHFMHGHDLQHPFKLSTNVTHRCTPPPFFVIPCHQPSHLQIRSHSATLTSFTHRVTGFHSSPYEYTFLPRRKCHPFITSCSLFSSSSSPFIFILQIFFLNLDLPFSPSFDS